MVRTVTTTSRLAAARAAFGLAAGATLAAPTSTKFEPQMEVQGTRLQLNGAGTRYKAIFKVYDMGLYTTKKVTTPPNCSRLPGPKRLQFTMRCASCPAPILAGSSSRA